MGQIKNLNNIPFTFYGDLLGVSNLYKVDLALAREHLDIFYNLIYEHFREMAKRNMINILLFSDFILITGKRFKTAIEKLTFIYNGLLEQDILIKGAMVQGVLEYENRIQLKNLQKRLPLNDILFKAVSLEKRINGMRIAIEKELAKDILPVHWLTDDSYKKHARIDGYQRDDLRRKIVLMSEWDAYEYLWPHTLGLTNFNKKELELCEMKFYKHPYVTIKEKLSQTPKDAKIHLRETMELFKRAEYRSRITNEALGPI